MDGWKNIYAPPLCQERGAIHYALRLVSEELLNIIVLNDFLLEDVSARLRRLYHLNALRVVTSCVTRLEGCDCFLCHCLLSFLNKMVIT